MSAVSLRCEVSEEDPEFDLKVAENFNCNDYLFRMLPNQIFMNEYELDEE